MTRKATAGGIIAAETSDMGESEITRGAEGAISLPLTFLSACEEGDCAALCLELDVASCGATLEEAEEALKGLIELYIADCLESGEARIPLRPVPHEALLEFLAPSGLQQERHITGRRFALPIHAAA
jgi:predicted RNase H-like HicB family nuclease